MRNFIQFLIRYHAFFLFLALEVVCLVFYFRSAEYPNAAVIYSANRFTGTVYDRYSAIRAYGRLGARNDSLLAENAQLRARLENARMLDSVHERCVDDSLYRQLYTYIPARIIRNSTSARNNYLTLDRGSAEGIRPDMGVICPDGIVGKVVAVSEHFSVVMSVLHGKFSSSAALRPTGNLAIADRVNAAIAVDSLESGVEEVPENLPQISGRLLWDGRNPTVVQLIDIPGHVQPNVGDPVFTTGFGTLYPEGIAVGKVHDVRESPGSYFLEVDVALSPDFSALRYAYVVNYLQKEEREQLENQAMNDGP